VYTKFKLLADIQGCISTKQNSYWYATRNCQSVKYASSYI